MMRSTNIHTYIHTYIDIYTHTHIHTHIHNPNPYLIGALLVVLLDWDLRFPILLLQKLPPDRWYNI
jgi:hypothetical protein